MPTISVSFVFCQDESEDEETKKRLEAYHAKKAKSKFSHQSHICSPDHSLSKLDIHHVMYSEFDSKETSKR